tara:strand:- start:712 stop:840 length:129 start_codon:yes stop_codon:yes gene_type:complete
MNSYKSQALIFIVVVTGIPNKEYDIKEVYELIQVAHCLPELR